MGQVGWLANRKCELEPRPFTFSPKLKNSLYLPQRESARQDQTIFASWLIAPNLLYSLLLPTDIAPKPQRESARQDQTFFASWSINKSWTRPVAQELAIN